MSFDSLKYSVDAMTGEVVYPRPRSGGIMAMLRDAGNEYVYMAGSFGMKEFNRLIKEMNPFNCFDGLLDFIHFSPMSDFETASIIEKRMYLTARESDIRTMKRLRAYVDMEHEYYNNN